LEPRVIQDQVQDQSQQTRATGTRQLLTKHDATTTTAQATATPLLYDIIVDISYVTAFIKKSESLQSTLSFKLELSKPL
jgi:threonine dehydratase